MSPKPNSGPVKPALSTLAGGSQNAALRTDDLLVGVKKRAVRGGAVTLLGQAVHFAVQFGLTIVLARLLEPADFGLVAMVRALTGFVQMFSDAGLSSATVQRKEVTQEQVSGLFWINAALGITLAIMVASAAPVVAWFYAEPRLTWVTVCLALSFVFAGLSAQHNALLKRRMRFKALVFKRVIGQLLGASVAFALAWGGYGYWALVAQGVVGGFASMLLAWLLTRWVPSVRLPGKEVRSMLAFGGFVSASRFLAYTRRNLDNVVIGAMWGPAALGLYRVAYRMILMPIQQVNSPVGSVMVPTLSRLASDPVEYRSTYRDALYAIVSVTLPGVVLMLLSAEDLVFLVLGDKWLTTVPIFLALGPAAIAGVLNIAAGWVFVSTGKVKEQLRANIYLTLFIAGSILAASSFGPEAIAAAFSASFCLSRLPHFLYAFKGTPVAISDVGSAIAWPVLATAIAAPPTWAVGALLMTNEPVALRFAAQVGAMFGIYALLNGRRLYTRLTSAWFAKQGQKTELAG